ncbi:hypothetical protein F8M41_012181 [Gigaspora margarita]|uniref:Uncharacterized protein n=1 Tax=Gigaspora margarita TaxID=4874 RepID=A0A8H3WYH1_GIGMA|nr:hypothetical protein F8M41_012181 [Gigaspora margarita]
MFTNDNTTPITNDTTTTTTITTTYDTTTPITNNLILSKPKPTETILIRKYEKIQKDGTKINDSVILKTKPNNVHYFENF